MFFEYFDLFLQYEENKQECIVYLFITIKNIITNLNFEIVIIKWFFEQTQKYNMTLDYIASIFCDKFSNMFNILFDAREYECLTNVILYFSQKREQINELYTYLESRTEFMKTIEKKKEIKFQLN